jgi:peptide/nickel transport system permease protein/oligopeptide transport system permease protein
MAAPTSSERLPAPGAWQRLRRDPKVIGSALLLGFVVSAAILGMFVLPAGAEGTSSAQFSPPSWKHPFGTDLNGRDVLYHTLEGARISLVVGVCGAFVAFVIGTTYGLISGYKGGKVDAVMMRIVDVLYAIPRLVFILIAISSFDPVLKQFLTDLKLDSLVGYSKILILILSLGAIEWLTMARIVRGQVLALKSQQFVLAARALGQSNFRIVVRHIFPNLLGVILIYVTLTIPAVILDESFLSFLGLGVQAPQASWGTLLSEGAQTINPIKSNWWLLVFPAVAMSLTLLALNFLGDGLRDALDPREKK